MTKKTPDCIDFDEGMRFLTFEKWDDGISIEAGHVADPFNAHVRMTRGEVAELHAWLGEMLAVKPGDPATE